jgi:thioredoxin 1
VATVELSLENFEQTVEGSDMVIIDFWAEWCGPCKMFGPIYEKVSEKFPAVTFAKVDTEANQQLAGMFNIQSIPTLMVIREQVVLFSQAGALPEAALEDIVNQALALDMVQVHAEIAEQQAN